MLRPDLVLALSKKTKLPVSTLTAPTEKRQRLAVEQIEIHQLQQGLRAAALLS